MNKEILTNSGNKEIIKRALVILVLTGMVLVMVNGCELKPGEVGGGAGIEQSD